MLVSLTRVLETVSHSALRTRIWHHGVFIVSVSFICRQFFVHCALLFHYINGPHDSPVTNFLLKLAIKKKIAGTSKWQVGVGKLIEN